MVKGDFKGCRKWGEKGGQGLEDDKLKGLRGELKAKSKGSWAKRQVHGMRVLEREREGC